MGDDVDEEAEFVFGLNLILTNRLSVAEEYFSQRIGDVCSSHLAHCKRVHATFGLALIAVLKALISFEEDEQQVALTRLYQTQKLASASSFSSLSSSSSSSSSWANGLFSRSSVPKDYQLTAIVNLISADAGVLIALLQFTSESALGFVNGAFSLRKSYKVYQKSCPAAMERKVNLPTTRPLTTTRAHLVEGELYFDALGDEAQLAARRADTGHGPLVRTDSTRQDRIDSFGLLGSGIFTLSFSMIPPRFQSVVGKALGFDTHAHKREDGLGLLVAAMNKRTSRGPIAALVLLSFHSAMLIMARGLSTNRHAREEEEDSESIATKVLEECLWQYPNSPMFRFLEGRLLRGKSQIELARQAFEVSEHCALGMNALVHLSLYERAWCEGLLHNFHRAGELFSRVAKESRWSPSFYSFLAASFYYEYAYRVLVLGQAGLGSTNSAKRALFQSLCLFRLVPTGVKMSRWGNVIPPEALALQRAKEVDAAISQVFELGVLPNNLDLVGNEMLVRLCTMCPFLPSLECLYIWNALFQSPHKEQLLGDLARPAPSAEPTSLLYRGYLLRELGRYREAEQELGLLVDGGGGGGNWAIEFAKYERGLCQFELGDKQKAAATWHSIKDTTHPMDSRLRFRLRAALNSL
ncbi:hypothetical protein BASA81_008074 [Batrachochytrium salamandrivorans]|nr:hypothetical protein BASA81_008074 [Batrachochytrium salamandrivorans]